MRAVQVRDFGGPEALEAVEVAVPEPGPGEVKVRVAAAAVNPVDLATREGLLSALLPALPVGIGWDVAGEVVSVGAGVTTFVVGDRVIGLRDRIAVPLGTYAEDVVLDEDALAPAPAGVALTAAATLPLNTLTAIQGLDHLGLTAGQTLLVTGGAGGVGGFAIELAAARGLRVVTVAGDADGEQVRRFGAEHAVARSGDPAADVAAVRRWAPGGVDGLYDAAVVGAAVLDAVRPRGTAVSVSGPGLPPLREIRTVRQHVHADRTQLTAVAALVTRGRLALRVADVLPLAEAAEAHRRLAKGGVRGRLVLVP